MAIHDKWNAKLVELKKQHSWLTNRVVARAIDVQVDRVNAWTKTNGTRMDHAYFELLELKMLHRYVTKENN